MCRKALESAKSRFTPPYWVCIPKYDPYRSKIQPISKQDFCIVYTIVYNYTVCTVQYLVRMAIYNIAALRRWIRKI